MLIIDHLVNSLQEAKKYNSNIQIAPATILWTDKERLWEPIVNKLQELLPELLILGEYEPKQMTGPVIWLKCVIANTLEEITLPEGVIPIIYLPGISRSDLRAIESCPAWLQGLAELQYRGAFWSQSNGKDWTINAFLTASVGGLGLDIAKDDKTQHAILRVLDTLLFDNKSDSLKGSQRDATFFNKLVISSPEKDLLTWMNDPKGVQVLWQASDNGARWAAFVELSTKEFGLNPEQEGRLGAAEALCTNEGAWSKVWQRFIETFHLYPNLPKLLEKVPLADLLCDPAVYVQHTILEEINLNSQLVRLLDLSPIDARKAIVKLEKTHAERREWIWAKLAYSPLAQVLQPLAIIAELAITIPGGLSPQEMAERYKESYWKIDQANLDALACMGVSKHAELIKSLLALIYTPWLVDTNINFQDQVSSKGYPNRSVSSDNYKDSAVNEATAHYLAAGECVFFSDGLRFDIAHTLVTKLEQKGFAVELSSNWSALPTVTSTAKAAITPIVESITGRMTDTDFQPSLKSDNKAYSQYYLKKLLKDKGWDFIASNETGDSTKCAWTECGDIDKEGHVKQLKLAQRINPLLDEIVERVIELEGAGWRQFRIITDHGWLLVPDGLPKVSLDKHLTETRWGRCAQLKEMVRSKELTMGWYWNNDVSIAMAPDISSFIAGRYYEHGGVSLQECLTPVLTIKSLTTSSY